MQVAGATQLLSTLTVASGGASITGPVSASSVVATAGPSSLSGGLDVPSGNVTLAQALRVDGPASLGSTLAVQGSSVLVGPVAMSSSLNVGGNVTSSGKSASMDACGRMWFLCATISLLIMPPPFSSFLPGHLSAASLLVTTGPSTLSGGLTVASGGASITGPVSASSVVATAGPSSLSGGLDVPSGNVTLAQALRVDGPASLGSTLAVQGSSVLVGPVAMSSSLNVGGNVTSSGKSASMDACGRMWFLCATISLLIMPPPFSSFLPGHLSAASLLVTTGPSTLSGGLTVASGGLEVQGNVTVHDTLSAASASLTGALSAASAAVTGNVEVEGKLTAASASVTGNINVVNGKVQEGGVPLLPTGMIMMWSGAATAIPSGWALCTGSNGTPNLRDRFVVGAGGSYAPGDTGGAATVTLTVDQMPGHTHDLRPHEHNLQTFQYPASNSGSGGNPPLFSHGDLEMGTTFMAGFTTSTAWDGGPTTDSTGSGQAQENRPPYFALCYVMKL